MATVHKSADDSRPSAPDELRVIGIDLGTTNSTVCELIYRKGQEPPAVPRCLNIDQPTTQGRYTHVLVPSVVALYGDQVWVGEGAKRLRAQPGAGLEEYKSWFAETKNDMGVRRTYHRAPAGFQSARAIAAEILRFLYAAARAESELPIARTVVTVPASFQVAQRQDTVSAAQRAGITLAEGDLLDEPVAAFLAYLAQAAEAASDVLPEHGQTKNLLVFDFGGGTCDVALFRLGRRSDGELTAAHLSVSRYHRLGGGDIDRAIIHEVLLPQLLEQNGLEAFDLSFEDKRQRIQPALLGVAEALKQKLSIEIARLRKLGRWHKIDKKDLLQTLPGVYPVQLADRTLTLESPRLGAVDFERVLEPFLDPVLLQPREDDYRITCSIFAPIDDALLRGRLDPSQVDLCLLAGGSSLIPQVVDAIARYFQSARILTFPSREDAQTAVAKGAALHALNLELHGRPFIRPVCHDDICLQTQHGPFVLVPKGAELPFPASGGYQRHTELKAPETVKPGAEGSIRIQLIAGEERRPLLEKVWQIRGPIRKGTGLWLDVRLDENQVLDLRMGRLGEEAVFEARVENPLSHVVNPNAIRSRIEDLEEELRTSKLSPEEIGEKFEELADLYRKIRQNEKALAYYGRCLRLREEPEAYLLNKMAFCCQELGDRKRAEEFFRQADQAEPWSGTSFNWALAKERWGEIAEALELVDRALRLSDEPAYTVLKARLLRRRGHVEHSLRLAAETIQRFPPIEAQTEFELAWLAEAARIVSDRALEQQAETWRRRRAMQGTEPPVVGGLLPELERKTHED